jgi:hypothetical protein
VLTIPSLIKLLRHMRAEIRSAAVFLLEKLVEHGEWPQYGILQVANVDVKASFMRH